jgi:copper chaperone CopZ
MTTTLHISGMTCEACQAKIEYLVSSIPTVTSAKANLQTGMVSIESNTAISAEEVAALIKPYPKYAVQKDEVIKAENVESNFFTTYKPILTLFGYLLGIALIIGKSSGWMEGMNVFMGGFFLAFSFFKMLDIKAFADSYAMYDIVAMRWSKWGYVYAFLELALGIAYIAHFDAILTNSVAFGLMAISIPGVILSVVEKKKIKCACLGTVFNLPMSTLTIVEDTTMLIMSGFMLWVNLF